MNALRPTPLPRGLYGVADDTLRLDLSVLDKARALVEAGVRVLQVRQKRASDAEALDRARAVVQLCRTAGALCLINDRVDLALMCGADGVHLGDQDLPVRQARELLGPSRLVGATARTLQAAKEVAREGADHVGVGPVFETSTKHVDAPPLGLEGLTHICRQSPLPVVAISGITLSNVEHIARAGAYAAAVVSDILNAEDIGQRARAVALAFSRGAHE